MATDAENAGFHVLPEFVCDAIPGPGVSGIVPRSAGENGGMFVLGEQVTDASSQAAGIDGLLLTLKAWPREYRDLFALRLGGLSLPEIADRLGTPQEVVAERLDQLVRALQR